jgi:acyl-CoA reductase-like NAD-dependent aldehyde dehydrogenase
MEFSKTKAAIAAYDRAVFNWRNSEFPFDSDVVMALEAIMDEAIRACREAFTEEMTMVHPGDPAFRKLVGSL